MEGISWILREIEVVSIAAQAIGQDVCALAGIAIAIELAVIIRVLKRMNK